LIVDGDGDGVPCDSDCDDGNAAMFPGNTEVADGIDNDCDGQVDESTTGCDTTETEPNNGWMAAESMALDTVMCGAIGTSGDSDTFRLTVPAWTQITMDIDTVASSALDSELYLLDDGGNVLQSNDDDGVTTDSLVSTLIVNQGIYYASVSDYNTTGSSNHGYELSVSTSYPCDVIEIEPNGTWTFADYMLIGQMACGTVTGTSDNDTFSFYAVAGSTVLFDVTARDAGSDLGSQLTLFDTDGVTQLADDDPGGFSDPSLSYTFATTGTYYIEVAADLWVINTSGPYLLNID